MSRNRTLQTSVRPALSKRNSPCAALEPAMRSFYAHAGLGPAIRRNEKYPRFIPRGSENHALGDAELHLARREIRHHYGEASLELFRRVSGLDAGEHGARAFAELERELEQLVRAVDLLGARDARHPQVELVEVVDGDLAQRVLLGGVLLLFYASLWCSR